MKTTFLILLAALGIGAATYEPHYLVQSDLYIVHTNDTPSRISYLWESKAVSLEWWGSKIAIMIEGNSGEQQVPQDCETKIPTNMMATNIVIDANYQGTVQVGKKFFKLSDFK